jgi:hypothetical protein
VEVFKENVMLIETILGGITGLLGNALGGWFKLKQRKIDLDIKKLDNAHEAKMLSLETKAMILEAKANIKITQAQIEGAVEIEDAKSYMQSQKEGNKSLFSNKWIDALMQVQGKWRIITLPIASLIATLFGFVDFLRGLIRPALTVYLCGVTTWVTWMAWEIMQMNGVTLTVVEASKIFNDVTSIVTYLTVSCVTWWFGDRRMAKSIMQKQGLDVKKMDDDIKID